MVDEQEPSKVLLPYLHRAREVEKFKPRISYYCRLYALERGLKIPLEERTKTTHEILLSLVHQLEKDKDSGKRSPEDKLYVSHFAMNVFMKADKQDRAGRADLDTAKAFYAASLFIEILHSFGEIQSDLEQKQKYAAWRAAEIRKAVCGERKSIPDSVPCNEGKLSNHKAPGDGLPDKETSEEEPMKEALEVRAEQSSNDDSENEVWEDAASSISDIDGLYTSDQSDIEIDGDDTSSSKNDIDHVSASHLLDVEVDQSSSRTVVLPAMSGSHISLASASFDLQEDSDRVYNENDVIEDDLANNDHVAMEGNMFRPSAAKIAEAHKISKLAVSALAFDDVPSAVSFLKQALQLLTIP